MGISPLDMFEIGVTDPKDLVKEILGPDEKGKFAWVILITQDWVCNPVLWLETKFIFPSKEEAKEYMELVIKSGKFLAKKMKAFLGNEAVNEDAPINSPKLQKL